MKEVKSPKKPLIFYYGIVLGILLVFNMFIYPLLMKTQVKEVDYGTFMKMINEKNIGEVEVADSEIIFTDKDKNTYYKTGAMDDPGLTERLYDAGAVFSKPPISWLQKPKPERPIDKPPRRLSAIDS